ncbi:NmrA family NAD(P)-binding protein [Flavobacterium sp.]|uniref:NmrA family NAD(P)-binding protein n=1 Tax=Flavobacterium sp. TaxID=239 RepID=UPI0025E5B769|nr:NmrA family NAD(P)-binding protein [Flavobacterium sp.]
MKILITGASGNVGMAVINSLSKIQHNHEIIAGIRDFNKDKKKFAGHTVEFVKFDFLDATTYTPALEQIDILFLLRPPQITDTKHYFKPIIEVAQLVKVKHIVFLSVQGVEKSSLIPHHKIEKLIVKSEMPHTFLRPAYFMQNFLNSLNNDLVNKRRIYLPAGNAKFTLVDVADIGNVAAQIIVNSTQYINKAYELTNNEKLTFSEMAQQLTEILDKKIVYQSPSIISFYWTKRKEKMPLNLIMVMIMLHYLPRFQTEPHISNCVKLISKKEPYTFQKFIKYNLKNLKK